jgi:molybdate transport system permease protein
VTIWGAVLNTDRAAGFWSYIRSAKGREIILNHGFTLPKDGAALQAAAPGPAQAEGIGPVVWLSLRVALLAVLIILPFGIFFGWLLARREFFAKDVLDAFLHLPLVLPPVVTGYALLWCFGRHGPFGGLGLAFTWEGAAIASAVVAFPLFVRAARLGFESVDARLEEAAQTLGASPRRVFFKVTLPLALSGIVSGAILAFGRSLGEFGATITFAGSVAGETETLPLALYAAIQTPEGEAQAMTLALVSTLLAFVSLIAGEWIARRVRWKS